MTDADYGGEGGALAERYCPGGDHEWQQRGSVFDHALYFEPVDSRSRRRCGCGCGKRASHRGMANGVCLTMGCEFSMAKWVRRAADAPKPHPENHHG